MNTTTSQLAAAKTRVMEQVSYVQKQRANNLPCSFAGVQAVIANLRPAMNAEGLSITPVKMDIVKSESFTNSKKTLINHVIVNVTYKMTHAASGESETIQALGESMDSGDKGCNKAMTAALKYCLMEAFLLESGDDPDVTPSTEYERKAQPTEEEVLKACRSQAELRHTWLKLTPDRRQQLQKVKDELKTRLPA